ncbi:hypothetical protein PHET_12251 [Paragonimus heterotremus]|uniref:ABC transmembrane type-1 domain-containing protein n=1 Tax=Paragonimus heterotremus TaxID=100268 RepID=A0A8J4T2N7_9TREM|nr:hypothetical protein PHET_12251 [Paragonimus heterotremus]
MVRLLYRFFDVSAGSILIGGQDIRSVNLDSLRRAIAVIPQVCVCLFRIRQRFEVLFYRITLTQAAVVYRSCFC